MKALFVNENLGGHRAMHLYLKRALRQHPDVEPAFLDIPAPGLARRLVGATLPGLGRLDADLQPLRYQLAQSAHGRYLLERGGGAAAYDVVHVYTQNATLLSTRWLAARPSVVSTDCTDEQNSRSLPYRESTRATWATVALTRRFEERVYRAATMVVAQSDWTAASLLGEYGISPDRLRVIPFGVTVPAAVARVPTPLPEITFVGSSMTRKGGTLLLDVYERHLRGRAVLNLVTLDRVPSREGVRVFADFHPGDPRLSDLLGRTAVFALPSGIDKSSYAVLEAMAAGVPVVACRYGAIPELVIDGETGLLIEPGDGRALASALDTLVEDAARRDAMGAAGRSRAGERFDAARTTAALVDVMGEAMARFRA